jgi:hypothetical protein
MNPHGYHPEFIAANMNLSLPADEHYKIQPSQVAGLVAMAGDFFPAVKMIRRRYPDRHSRPVERKLCDDAIGEMMYSSLCHLWMQLVDKKVRLRGHNPVLTRSRRRL